MDSAADPMRAADDAMRVLQTWEQHPPTDVLDAVWAAPIHLQRALAGQWWALPPLDRADLYALRIAAEDLGEHGPAALEKDGAARLAPIITECAYFAGLAEPERQHDPSERQHAVRRAADHLTAYRRLTPDQQAGVLSLLTPEETTTTRMLGSLTAYVPPVPDPDAGTRPPRR